MTALMALVMAVAMNSDGLNVLGNISTDQIRLKFPEFPVGEVSNLSGEPAIDPHFNHPPVSPTYEFAVEFETFIEHINLRSKFMSAVSEFQPEPAYSAWVQDRAAVWIKGSAWKPVSQYFVLADRNPDRQLVMVGYYDQSVDCVFVIGWDKCSTGNPAHGKDYYWTPTGIFANTLDNFGYRAQGTRNAAGWRGLGGKGSRVWDFGYQMTTKPIKGKEESRQIRLLMHATNPDRGEAHLGTIQSKACVRISARLNKFIDHYCLLDAIYLKAGQASTEALLAKDRQPLKDAGNYLIIIDSTGVNLAPKAP